MDTPTFTTFHRPSPAALQTRDWKKWHEEHPYVVHPRMKYESAADYDKRIKGAFASHLAADRLKGEKGLQSDRLDIHRKGLTDSATATNAHREGAALERSNAKKATTSKEANAAADRAMTHAKAAAKSANDTFTHAEGLNNKGAKPNEYEDAMRTGDTAAEDAGVTVRLAQDARAIATAKR